MEWLDDSRCVVGGVEFLTAGTPTDTVDSMRRVLLLGAEDSTPERFVLLKPRPTVARYARLVKKLAPKRIVELGIYKGGSVAFLAELAQPESLVAFDIDPNPVAALDRYPAVSAVYGVDQADTDRLADAVGAGPFDLIVDDASHLLDPTRASFWALFPRLRPGGAYVIEDWSWGVVSFDDPAMQAQLDARPELAERPLAHLLYELVVECANRPELVRRVEVSGSLAIVWRG